MSETNKQRKIRRNRQKILQNRSKTEKVRQIKELLNDLEVREKNLFIDKMINPNKE